MTAETPTPPAAEPGRGSRIWSALQLLFSLALALAALGYLLWMPPGAQDAAPKPARPPQAVQIAGYRQLRIDPDSSLAKKLEIFPLDVTELSVPLLRVTGSVAASLRPGPEQEDVYWQFDDPEVLELFYDWQKSQFEREFAEAQQERMRNLVESKVAAQRKVVERLERLVRAGTDTAADLELARAELLETEIEGRRDIHEAEMELRVARQEQLVLVRQLQRVGMGPAILEEATADHDIVVAEVPEGFQHKVYVGQKCEARFFGRPREVFPSVVRAFSPVVTPERRTLRVLFFVDDPDDKLRPGMFAEIGLGTDLRQTLLVPATAVVHVGREDFVIVRDQTQPDLWHVSDVEVGDAIGNQVEILSGLSAGDTVVAQGSILLKPAASESMNRERVDEVPGTAAPTATVTDRQLPRSSVTENEP